MKVLIALLRLAAVAATVVAIIGQFAFTAARTEINFFNFFGYFTIQSNILAALVLFVSALFLLSRRRQPGWLVWSRGAVTAYMVTVGVVYNTLLTGANLENAFNLQWSNDILHIWIPIYIAADWLIFGDRRPIPWNRFWPILIYPIVWAVVVLLRGSLIDGWFAYPFLDPAKAGGVGAVIVYIIAIGGFVGLIAAVVVWLSRLRLIKT